MSDRTNADFAARKGLDPNDYEVVRMRKVTGTFSTGVGEPWEQEYWIATIKHRQSGRRVARKVRLSPSTFLCLPDRSVSADKATDEETILGFLGDEPIF